MRRYGVNYDTGLTLGGRSTRRVFDAGVARRELQIIAADLQAGAVRVSGDDLDRLFSAGQWALEAGMELWFSPFPHDLEPSELVDHFIDCAERAEELRRGHEDVVLVAGLPHRADDPRRDLDPAAYGLVATLEHGHGTTYPGMTWEPKRSFHAIAAAYAGRSARADA